MLYLRTLLCLLIKLALPLSISAVTVAAGWQSGNTNTTFDQSNNFLPVEQAYPLDSIYQADGHIQLHWQIADGYYLYRHGFRFALTDESGQQQPIASEIAPGKAKDDPYFGAVEVYYGSADVLLSELPAQGRYHLDISSQGCADAGLCYPPYTVRYLLDVDRQTLSPAIATAPAATDPTPRPQGPYALMLLFALAGGLILNLMPCVFPVLSLKVLGFASDHRHSQALHGWSYSIGVVVSFIAIALLLLALQATGRAVGWGFHLQSPWFVGALSYLFFVMGLSLAGYIELGNQWMGMGGRLTARSGYSGSFFTGVLATVVASPCTAPMMGTALGFAITQPPGIALSLFATLGIGMALPVLILSHAPALLKRLPKPGVWMEKFKQLLSFPLFATAIWLAWVVGNQSGVNAMAAIIGGCLLLAFALWLWSRNWSQQLLALGCLTLALSLLVSPWLDSETPAQSDQRGNYSAQALRDLRQQRRAVFVDVTADWCITCLANERLVLNNPEIKRYFAQHDVTYMRADWTRYDPQITALLAQHGRNGIPLYLLYPSDPQRAAIILPQILSKSAVIRAIDEVSGK